MQHSSVHLLTAFLLLPATSSSFLDSIGPCENGLCPPGHSCDAQTSECLRDFACVSALDSVGPCSNGAACQSGYKCDLAEDLCCPNFVANQPTNPLYCNPGKDSCPEGFGCVGGVEGRCMLLYPCSDSIGPCVTGLCPAGHGCNNGFCCKQ